MGSCLLSLWNETGSTEMLTVGGKALFSPQNSKVPLKAPVKVASLRNACTTSQATLRQATFCCLEGSCASIEKTNRPLSTILMKAGLVVGKGKTGTGKRRREEAEEEESAVDAVTPLAMQFCMMSLQQQWWMLVKTAVDCALSECTAKGIPVTKLYFFQLLAVLAMLDSNTTMYHFPSATEDPSSNVLLVKLANVGLVYPVKQVVESAEAHPFFVLSPFFKHALVDITSAPLCITSVLPEPTDSGTTERMHREDIDTIITETNFRLYVYTDHNMELLNVVSQFGKKEEEVGNVLVCYRVTRESFSRALRKGITASQIIKFLTLKAHPSMIKKYGDVGHKASPEAIFREGTIPQSVCDQFFAWEREFNRIRIVKDVVLLKNLSPESSERVVAYLNSQGEADAILHQETGYLVLTQDAFELVKSVK
ncbi:transcription initiation factor TFIIH subunit 4 [Angomonas deanei]|uniref:General transcription factor IIH subunit 4 n=1 Tax=Angomonas deanei TaxID=59799 RepID=A0A7G2C5W5_9TRYP|nr:transcription initiation factor TFIIH subunit 4 [Angomonas deanei]CAD2214163.1 Transcription factor Tfb2, putative [Angomonas deanei]|eukprot:EPY26656.1 transcription initiation factor TFIIH subunit 4 [Angomonas deanei]